MQFLRSAALVACLAPASIFGAEIQKIASVDIVSAILNTQEGQQRRAEIQAKYAAVGEQIRAMQAEAQALRDRLKAGEQTLNEEGKRALVLEIDRKDRSVQRTAEDAERDMDQDEGRAMQEIGSRALAIIQEFATKNGYSLVLESSGQGHVLFVADQFDVTQEIAREYDRRHPSGGAAAPSAP